MMKLLLLEDDPMIGSVYTYHFTAAGYEVEQATDGRQALQALENLVPDVVVLDLMLPRTNGVEFIRRLRSQPATVFLPVVVFANEYVSNMVSAAKKAGADECVIKAKVTTEALLSAIDRARQAHNADRPSPPSPPAPAPAAEIVSIPVEPAPHPVPTPPEPVPVPAAASAPPAQVKLKPTASPECAPAVAPPLNPRAEFLASAPPSLAHLRALSQKLLRSTREADKPAIVFDLYRAVHALTAKAAFAQAQLFAQTASAIEALLKELDDKPNRIDDSTIRTVNQSIEFLDLLFHRVSPRPHDDSPEFKILVVDDDVVARKSMSRALELASLKSVTMDDPLAAYEMLKKESFDLVVTDINMPTMDGFELCEKLRAMPTNAKTPVIFVTTLNAFESRMRSAQSGGDDFIGKPFLYIELAVKALTHLLRAQLKDTRPTFQAYRPEAR